MNEKSDQFGDTDFQSVAIIGMAGRFPGAPNVDAYWHNLINGVESIVDIDETLLRKAGVSDVPEGYIKRASILKDIELFDAEFFGVAPSEAALIDPQHRLLLECAYEAIEHAAYNPYDLPAQVGVYTGVSLSDYLLANIIHRAGLLESAEGLQILMGNDKSYASTRISHKFGLRGPSLGIDSACSTALVAIHQATRALLTYECDMAIAGAAKVAVPQAVGYMPREGDIMSSTGQCRPFDAQASGTIHGSGGGVVILKRLVDAIEDQDQIHAVIRGSAINNDGNEKIGYTAPGMQGQTDVIVQAMAVAGIEANNIDYIEAHGTGTRLGDPIEMLALTQAFGSGVRPQSCAIGSVKGNIGHLDVAAGMASIIKVVLAMKHRQIPPSLHFESANPEIDFANSPFFVNAELREWTKPHGLRTAGISSFGIGGTNAHMILEELDPKHRVSHAPEENLSCHTDIFCLSAQSALGLSDYAQRYVDFLQDESASSAASLADICLTTRISRPHLAARRLLWANSKSHLSAALKELKAVAPTISLQTQAPVVVFMFTGQGSQYSGMASELYKSNRLFRQHFDEISTVISQKLECRLEYYLWEAPEEELADTRVTQLALLGLELALANYWRSMGIIPDYLIGHSIGEIVAACFSEMLSLEDAVELVHLRSSAMMAAADDGAMLAVAASGSQLKPFLETFPALSVAAFNAPDNTVISGDSASIDQLSAVLEQNDIKGTQLRVSKAFHSNHMDSVLPVFDAAISHISFAEPQIPIISTVQPTLSNSDLMSSQYWVEQIRKPVRFQAAVEFAQQQNANVFLEIGPQPTLTHFGRQSIPEYDALWMTSLSQRYDDSKSMFSSLAKFYEAGGELDFSVVNGLDGDASAHRVALPSYPFQRTRHWLLADDLSLTQPAHSVEQSAEVYDAPLNKMEISIQHSLAELSPLASALNACWRNTLGVVVVDPSDDFFDLGGHSLMILQLIDQIKQSLRLTVPNYVLAENPRFEDFCVAVEELASAVDRGADEDALPSSSFPLIKADISQRYKPFPLVELQQSFLVGRRSDLGLGGVSTHLYFELWPIGLDVPRFVASLNALIQRHDMLRAIIVGDSEQKILQQVPYFEPTSYRKNDATIEGHLEAVRKEMSHQILPEDCWPLFDFRLTKRGNGEHIIHVSMDLLMLDVRSNQILFRDLDLLYAGRGSELPELPISYRDYVMAEQKYAASQAFEQAKDYWLKRIATLPLAPDLPLMSNPASMHAPTFKRHLAVLDEATSKQLHERSRQQGVTLSVLLLAAYGLILSRWSKDSRFSLNMTMFNRLPLHPCVDHLVGDFTNVSLLALDYSKNMSITQHAHAIQKQLWRDAEHRSFSGINVLRELTRHYASQRKSEQPVIMPVVFTSALPLGDIDKDEFESLGDESLLSQYDEGSSISQTPQVWIDHVASEEEGHILLSWDSLEGLFPANMIEDMFAQYESLVRQLAQDDQVWQQLRLDLLPQEQKMLRDTKNQTEHPMPQKTALGFYLQNVEKQPSAAAILGQQYKISYAELHRYVMVWSRWLRAKRVGKGDYVGIIMEKDWQEPVAVLAVNLAGAAYVPINAHWPQARQISIIESIDLSIILTQPQCAAGVEALGEHILGVIDEQHNIASEQENDELDWSLPGVGDCSHVIFTSGSSGLPKGVSISHGAMANTVFEIVDRFRLKPKDRILALSAITFDLSVLDMFAAFSSGAGLVVPLEKMRRDSQALNALLDQHQVSMVNAVPALVAALIDQRELTKQELPKSLRLFIMGGDFIPVSLPDRIRKLASDEIVIMSMGGPTETVIYSIGYEIGEVDAAWPSIPYGSAMRNRKCWVVDDQLNDRPEGVPGEIITGGHGVLADGYWANEELTAEKFTSHPDTGEPIFKTGDLGLYLPSGEIRILGRRDFQVKINGFRVELSEIERLLSCHESVKQAIVNAQRSDQMASSLIAYVVPRDGVLFKDIQAELSALCKENLPEYMAPHVFIELDSLPLSANGKVDRNALPEHVVEHIQREHVAARNETEQVLLEIWQELLSDPKMGIHDNFFDQGGHSLIAMQMQTRIRSALVKECTIGVIFSHPSVVELAQFLESETNVKADLTPLEKAPEGRLQRPSFAQQRLWFIDQLDKHTEGYHSAYNMPIIWKIEGDLNAAYMRKALEHVIDRHSVLRTVFNNEEGRAFTEQIVSYELPWRSVDLSAVKQSDVISETWQNIQNEVERPFDLSRAPLVRGLLLTQSKIVSYLVITMHHIVTDAWSIALMNEELLSAYQTLQEGGVLVAEPPAWEYADFAHWQHDVWQTEQMQVYEDYWLNRMDPLPEPLRLPTDFSVPLQKNYLGVALPFTLDAEEVASIDLLASEFQLTTFIALMSAFSILLSRYTNQNDIVIGTDVANRFPAQTENMLGYFINQIALRVDVSQGDSVEAFLDQLRQSILQDIEHEHMPLDRLIDRLALARDLSSTPLFQVKLNYHSVVDADLEYSELNIENQAYDFSAIQYDLVMTFKREGDQIAGTLQYRKELFAESSMVRLIEHFRTLVLALGVAEDWPKPVQRLVMQRPEQLAQQLELARASTRFPLSLSDSPDADKPVSESLIDRFNRQQLLQPDRIAVQDGDSSLSYSELGLASDKLATLLISEGVAVGDFVGLYLERGVEQVIGILAVLKTGAAYVPLDPHSPAERLNLILEDASPVVVITDQAALERTPLAYDKTLLWEDFALDDIEIIDDLSTRVHAHLTAYMIYTSGTTGRPNGVMVSHHNVTRLLDSCQDFYQFDKNDVWSFFHTYVFDVSVWELWGALSFGGKLVVVPYWTCRSAEEFHALLVHYGVTVLCQTPSAFQPLNQFAVRACNNSETKQQSTFSLRYIIFAGEALDIPSLEEWFDCFGDTEPAILNMYGITETTVHASLRRITKQDTDSKRSVIGGSIGDLDLYVLNDNMEPQAIGLAGELYVAGDGLTQGYRNRASITAARFIPNPFSDDLGSRLYKSGDLARWTYDGELEYLGRVDNQLQIRGHRVELGEIEFHLNSHEALERAVVLSFYDEQGKPQLVAYWIPCANAESVDQSQLNQWLSDKVPSYMLPSSFVCIDALPLTINGKVDTKTLATLKPDFSANDVELIAAQTQTERELVSMVSQLLSLEDVGINQNFFMIGGHSLLATQLNARIQTKFDVDLALKPIFEMVNFRQLAEHIDTKIGLQIADQIVARADAVPSAGQEEFLL